MTIAATQSDWQTLSEQQPLDIQLERAKRGDRSSRAKILNEFQDVWFRFCMSQLHDEHLARDATQETALRFLQSLESFRGDSALKTGSLGIALNVCRELMRTRGRVINPHDYQAMRHGEVEDNLPSDEYWRVHELMEQLPARQREAVVLRYFEQLNVQETADVMQCAVGTVKATVSQALRSLRKLLKE
jgi:RNA polymerase sigma factor (sigma-70 family)